MKPFLAIDITENKDNQQYNGEEFIVSKTSQAQVEALDRTSLNTIEMINKAQLNPIFRILKLVCGFLALVSIVGIGKAMLTDGLTLEKGYNNAPWIFWIMGVSAIVWVLLTVIERKRFKELSESEEAEINSVNLDNIVDNIYNELGVPSDAEDVEILSFSYKLRDEVPIVKEKWGELTPYTNFVNKAFVQDSNLFIADREAKYSFPLSEMRVIRTVKKSITIPTWYKDIPYNKDIYKDYKIWETNEDLIGFKPYHILELEHNGETWGIYFPCYELPIFEKLTGLKAE